MLGLVDSFSNKWLAFLWEKTVPHYEFLDKLNKEGKNLARKFNLSHRYTDDLISFSNRRFKEFISDIYPKELTNF